MLDGYKKRGEYINKLPVAKVNYWQYYNLKNKEEVNFSKHSSIKSTSPNCKQMGLDLIFFIVQMDATGPSRYTFTMQR